MKWVVFVLILLLPQCVWAGPISTWIEGDEDSLLSGASGNYDHQSHQSSWLVDTSDLSGSLLLRVTTTDQVITGFVPGSGGGGGGTATISELPLEDGQTLVFANPVVFGIGWSHIFNGPGSLVRNTVTAISGLELDLAASSVELEFISDNQFIVTSHFVGTVTEDYVVVPEPATLMLLAAGALALGRRR